MADTAPNDTSLQSTKQMLDELDALMERMLAMPVNEVGEPASFPRDASKAPTLSASLTLLEQDSAPSLPISVPKQTPVNAVVSPLASVSMFRPVELSQRNLPTQVSVSGSTATTVEAAPPPRPLDRQTQAKQGHPSVNSPHFTPTSAKPAMLDIKTATPFASASPSGVPEVQPLTNDVLPPTVSANFSPNLTQVRVGEGSSPRPARLVALLLGINQAFDNATSYLGGAGALLRSMGGRMVLGFSGIALFLAAVGWVVMDLMGWNW